MTARQSLGGVSIERITHQKGSSQYVQGNIHILQSCQYFCPQAAYDGMAKHDADVHATASNSGEQVGARNKRVGQQTKFARSWG